ncbi:hypothetical protein AURDEDRAFT_175697 [Auricularia subglabra TFB-10046 SS5]|nr:hypothetical protein AURDEDRAFT_175697 [Auricularia subglabra TFB-10046 SS5]
MTQLRVWKKFPAGARIRGRKLVPLSAGNADAAGAATYALRRSWPDVARLESDPAQRPIHCATRPPALSDLRLGARGRAVPDVLTVSPVAAYPASSRSSPRRAILGLRAHGSAVPDVLTASPAAAHPAPSPSSSRRAILGLGARWPAVPDVLNVLSAAA